MTSVHIPVLLEETMKYLQPTPHKKFLDCTLGAAGHTLAMLKEGASVTGIDRDLTVLDAASESIKHHGYPDRFSPIHSSFSTALSDESLAKDYDGILFDLGVSSIQLDTASRGFSFRYDAPLDMRMDPDNQQVTSKDLVNGLGRKELHELFRQLGEERSARRLTDAICRARRLKPIETTQELAKIISDVSPRSGHLHPATRVFQALRMAVNSEREELESALPHALDHLKPGGALAVISFHSGEDRIVKQVFSKWQDANLADLVTRKPITPTDQEIDSNPRSRSAKLRVIKKRRPS